MSCGCQPAGNDCKVSPPKRNVERIRDPTPAPEVKRCVKRLPTPPGDTIERIRVVRQPQQIIEKVTEQPRKPPPKTIERTENEPAPPPIVRQSCVNNPSISSIYLFYLLFFKYILFKNLKVLVDPSPRPEPPAPCGCAAPPPPPPAPSCGC